MNVSLLVANLISPTNSAMMNVDVWPFMSVWDVSLYTRHNITAKENKVLLRKLMDDIDA